MFDIRDEDLCRYIMDRVRLKEVQLGDEYFYRSLSFCVLDAVFSIGVRYAGVKNVIGRYCSYFGLSRLRKPIHFLPPREERESISEFCSHYCSLSVQHMTSLVYENKQRTSSTSGILKSEAALLFAQTLKSYGIEHLQDVALVMQRSDFEADIRRLKGQSSGTSLAYFWMLAGSERHIKPDRMVLRFLADALSRDVTVQGAQALLTEAAAQLKSIYPHMNPRLLDHAIWLHQRGISRPAERCSRKGQASVVGSNRKLSIRGEPG